MEETNIEVTPETTSAEVEQTTPDVEPEKTTQTQEPEATEAETSTEETSQPAEKTETLESITKALKDTKAELTRLQQERAKEKALIEQSKFEQQKTQVETGNVQLKQEYQAILTQLNAEKNQYRQQALAEYNETGDITLYNQTLAQIDGYFEQSKNQLDYNYKHVEQELTKQQRELLTLTQQRNLQAFKAENAEFCEKYKPVIDKYLELGYDPQDLGAVKELLNVALGSIENSNSLVNENNEAKGKLVSSATNQATADTDDGIPSTWKEVVKKMDKNPNWYIKNQARIMEKRNQGLIK